MKDYYGILGINSAATAQEIKKAYRDMAKKWHPDVNKSPDAQNKFVEITEAYEILMNSTTRQQYDGMRNSGSQGHGHSHSYGGSSEARESDFNRARESARQRGREYSSISLDELFETIFRGAVDLGKTTIMGEKDYTDSLTLGGKLKIGLKGWFAVLLLILTFTGILAPITIPLLLKMVMISKGKVVGLVPILAGMVLYLPFMVMFVLFVGYSLDILYIYESQYVTYMVVLLVIAAAFLTMAYKSSSSFKGRSSKGAWADRGLQNMAISKKMGTASIFVLLYLIVHWLGSSLDSDIIFRFNTVIVFLAGVVLGPLFGLVTGLFCFMVLNFNLDYFFFSFYISNAVRVSVIGLFGGLITLDNTFDIFNKEVNQRHLMKIFIYILLSIIADVAIVYISYNIYYSGYWDIGAETLKYVFRDLIFLTIVTLPIIKAVGKWSKK